jgi:hypothetical protein
VKYVLRVTTGAVAFAPSAELTTDADGHDFGIAAVL